MGKNWSENIFDKFFNNSIDLLCVADKAGNFIKLNPEWKKTLGYELAEMENKPYLDFVHPEDIEKTIEAAQNLTNNEEVKNFTNRYRHKDGTYRWLEWRSFPERDTVFATARDITRLKKAEEDLAGIHNLHQTVLDTITVGLVYAKHNKFEWVNKTFLDMFKYNLEEIKGQPLSVIYKNRKDYEKIFTEAIKSFASGEVYHNEIKVSNSNRDIQWIRFTGKTLTPEKPEDSTVWMMQDITEKKLNEENLFKFKCTVDEAMDGIVWLNEKGEIGYTNNRTCELLGYTRDELLKMKVFDIDPFYTKEQFKKEWSRYKKNQQTEGLHLETIQRRKDGSLFPVEVLANHFWFDDKEIQVAHIHDITDRKQNEENLNRFKTSIDNAMDGVFIVNEYGGFDYVNEQACKMLGYTHEELINLNITDINPSLSLEEHKTTWKRLVKEKKLQKISTEHSQMRKDGSFIPVEVDGIFMWMDNKGLIISYVRDITERKKYEETLLKNQKILKESQRIANIGIWENNIVENTLIWNEEAYKIFGYDYREIDLTREYFSALVHPDDIAFVNSISAKIKQEKRFFDHENRIIRKDGEIRTILVVGDVSINDEGEVIRAYGIIQDITERKKHEEELLKNQKLLVESQRIARIGSWDMDLKTLNVTWSKQTYSIFGYKSFDEPITLDTFYSFVIPEDQDYIRNIVDKAIETNHLDDFECRIISKDGKQKTVYGVGEFLYDDLQKPVRLLGAVQDITERKQATEALINSEQKLQSLFRVLPVGIGIVIDRVIVEVNPQLCEMTGYSKEEIIGKSAKLLYPSEEEFLRVGKVKYEQIAKKGTGGMETIWKRKDGATLNIFLASTPIDPKDLSKGVTFTALNITERKQYEEALEKRVLALTKPLGDIKNIKFTDLFNLDELQKIQDTFAKATGVASLITYPDGKPITKPSNFCQLCDLIRSTEIGEMNCNKSDAEIGKFKIDGPTIQPCLSGGLWNAGASIVLGGVHIANWLIGQVRNERLEESKILGYADNVGIDRTQYMEAYNKVPSMSYTQFEYAAEAMYNLANELSLKAYQNVQQARFITEQKETEKQLIKAKERAEESEYFLRESQRTGNIGSYKMSFSTGDWISTETLDRIFGIDHKYKKDVAGWLNVVHPEDREMMDNYFHNEVIDKKQPFNYEYRIIRKKDKIVRWMHGVGKLYFDGSGDISEMLGTIQDITERKLIEEEKKKMNIKLEQMVKERTAQLQQVNKDLEAFAYSVSHDLRAPIRHINGFVNLIQNSIGPTDKKIQSYFEKVMNSSKGMSVMIDELLKYSRLGRTELSYTEINLSEMVNEIIEQFTPDYANRLINWKIKKLPKVKGDPTLLKIVLENLISNSIKYTSTREHAEIEIGEGNSDVKYVSFYIKDNGVGFDMTYEDKLFGVFQRLHKGEEFDGIGIGLANVKQIISKHDGTIEAKSELDKGSTFFIRLPKL